MVELEEDRVVYYFEAEGVSQSDLSALDQSPSLYKIRKEGKDFTYNENFIIGSLIDEMLTNPDGYSDKYYVHKDSLPTGQLKSYVEHLYKYRQEDVEMPTHYGGEEGETYDPEDERHYEETARMAWLACGNKQSVDTMNKKFKESGIAYFEALSEAGDRTIVDEKTFTLAEDCVINAYQSPFTQKYLSPDAYDSKTHTHLFQLPVFWVCKGIHCKSLIDIVIIDHENKTIQPIDIKTTGDSVYSFISSFVNYRYYLQASYYTAALHHWKESDEAKEVVPDFDIKGQDYTVLPFKFLVIPKIYGGDPIVWSVDPETLELGEYGGTLKSGRKVKGFVELLDDFIWHTKNDSWQYKREVYERGELTLSLVN